jgi:histone-lysine N-methyltransferase SUV39H
MPKYKSVRAKTGASSQGRPTIESNQESSDSEDIEQMFMPSPPPEESFSDAEGANSDGEWPLEIIGEEIDHYGNIKYEVCSTTIRLRQSPHSFLR